MPIVEGDWEQSTRAYDSREAAACALIFDLSFYTSYRFSQVRRLFRQTGMRGTFTDEELDDIVEVADEVQDGRSYPPAGFLRRRRFVARWGRIRAEIAVTFSAARSPPLLRGRRIESTVDDYPTEE